MIHPCLPLIRFDCRYNCGCPVGIGNAAILPAIAPDNRRVRSQSAKISQQSRACLISPPRRLPAGGARRQAAAFRSSSAAPADATSSSPSQAIRPGGNAHRLQTEDSGPTLSHPGLHELNRIDLLDRNDGLPQREVMRDGDQIKRWVSSGRLAGDRKFRKVVTWSRIP